MIKGAIFDLDGTRIDSMSAWEGIGEAYLHSLGIEPRERLADTLRTLTVEQSAEYFRQSYGVELSVTEIVSGINTMLEDLYVRSVPLKRGVEGFLKRMRRDGVRMCVATVTDKRLAEAALARLDVLDCFEAVVSTSEVGRDKTEPFVYRKALSILGTEKSETAVFEDSYHALLTAKKDGFRTVAVYDPSEPRQAEMKALADRYIVEF